MNKILGRESKGGDSMGTHCTASFLVKFKPFIRLPTKISHRDDQKQHGGILPQNGLIMISKTEKVCCFCMAVHVP